MKAVIDHEICAQCMSCVSSCPYGIDVRSKLMRAHEELTV